MLAKALTLIKVRLRLRSLFNFYNSFKASIGSLLKQFCSRNSCLFLQRQIVKDFLIKFTKKPQKKCQKQILAPDTFADGLFAPA